ncbi:hypothetical protein SAMN05446037_1014102, partial [Anaerovirgula multivorans]
SRSRVIINSKFDRLDYFLRISTEIFNFPISPFSIFSHNMNEAVHAIDAKITGKITDAKITGTVLAVVLNSKK